MSTNPTPPRLTTPEGMRERIAPFQQFRAATNRQNWLLVWEEFGLEITDYGLTVERIESMDADDLLEWVESFALVIAAARILRAAMQGEGPKPAELCDVCEHPIAEHEREVHEIVAYMNCAVCGCNFIAKVGKP